MECGEISGIYARWVGGDISDASQDTLVLQIGHVILAFMFMVLMFGIGLMVLGIEFMWLKIKERKEQNKVHPISNKTWIEKISFFKSKDQ
jgi:predicted membrane protein